PDKLRFDFTQPEALTPEQRHEVERLINEKVFEGLPVRAFVVPMEEARKLGAMMLFEEKDKYGERVRVVEVPGFSKELCGGTHVHQTGEIGLFLVTTEQGISAGTRRVEALTGEAAVLRAQADQGILEELEEAAKVDRRSLVDEYARL